MVLILEWDLEASLVEPRPQTSHFFAIMIIKLLFMEFILTGFEIKGKI